MNVCIFTCSNVHVYMYSRNADTIVWCKRGSLHRGTRGSYLQIYTLGVCHTGVHTSLCISAHGVHSNPQPYLPTRLQQALHNHRYAEASIVIHEDIRTCRGMQTSIVV